MSENEETVEVVEETADDEVTEDEVEPEAEEILGATPAEEAPAEEPLRPSEQAVADARARIAELQARGYSLSQLTVTTNSRGAPVAVEIA